jgi:hypothetical protein
MLRKINVCLNNIVLIKIEENKITSSSDNHKHSIGL